MNHGGDGFFVAREQTFDARPIANIQIEMAIVAHFPFEPVATPQTTRVVAEEDAPHIVVDTDDVETVGGEESYRLGADQSGSSRHYGNTHLHYLSIGTSSFRLSASQ